MIILLPTLANIINTPYVSAQTAGQQFGSGLSKTADKMGYAESSAGTARLTLSQKIGRIIQAVLASVGVLFLILTVYGGVTWMLSRGNEQQAAKAKSILTNAIIGLIIVLSAYIITTMMIRFWGETADVGDHL